MDREPITTVADLDALDDEEIIEGYRDALCGDPAPGDNRSLSYWHGYRNGCVDAGRAVPDAAMRALAADYMSREG